MNLGQLVATIGGTLAILALLLGVAAKWGAHEQQVMDQGREILRLQQIISLTHPETAEAFGLNRKEE